MKSLKSCFSFTLMAPSPHSRSSGLAGWNGAFWPVELLARGAGFSSARRKKQNITRHTAFGESISRCNFWCNDCKIELLTEKLCVIHLKNRMAILWESDICAEIYAADLLFVFYRTRRQNTHNVWGKKSSQMACIFLQK